MATETPDGLRAASRLLGSLNGQEHVTDTALHQVKSYGFFVHEGGCVITTLELDPAFNSGDLTAFDGAALSGPAEYVIPGILGITLTSGAVSLFKDGR